MIIIIEQVGKKSQLCFFFWDQIKRFDSMFYLEQLLIITSNNNNSISKECLWCFAKETVPLYFRSLKG